MSCLDIAHLLSIQSLSLADIHKIFDLTTKIRQEPCNTLLQKLQHITIANIFFENSTRTKLAFEVAEKNLGMKILNFAAQSSSLKKGETLLDTVKNIVAMQVQMVVLRHADPGAAYLLSQHVDAHIINAGDGTHEHPTQALQDAYTMHSYLGNLYYKHIAILGDIVHSRVALSNIFLLQKLGAKVMVCSPNTLLPSHIHHLGVKVAANIQEAVDWCDVAYVLRIQKERQKEKDSALPSLREYQLYFGLNKALVKSRKKKIWIMHPGPINPNVEITDYVVENSPAILTQVRHGVAIRMAVLYLLATSSL